MKSLETRIRFIAGDKISCSKFVRNLTIPSIMTSALQGKFSVYGVNSKLN